MKIGVIGSGDVGRVLASGLADLGYEVMIGTRDASNAKVKEWVAGTKGKGSVGSFSDTASFGEVILVAVKGDSLKEVLSLAGPDRFAGKTVIDVTNPLDMSSMPPKLTVGFNNSNGEIMQKLLPKANVVKTLNIIGNARMVQPKFKQGDPDMLLCGNSDSAKKQVTDILRRLGWKNITDLGGIEQSRIMEPLCVLWVTYALKNNSWTHAFKMLKE